MHHNLGFSFFLFCKPANPKMQRQLPSFERKMPCGFRILRRNSNHLGHFAYPPGETSLLSSVSTAAGSATFVATRHCFFEPKCRPLRCSSSGYRGAIGLPLVGPDRVDPSLRFGRYGRTLGNLARISQIFAISRQLPRALAISKTTHCIRLSTADKGQGYG